MENFKEGVQVIANSHSLPVDVDGSLGKSGLPRIRESIERRTVRLPRVEIAPAVVERDIL